MDDLSEREALITLAHCVEPADAQAGRLLARVGPVGLVDLIRRRRTGLRHDEGLAARLGAYRPCEAEQRRRGCGARVVTRVDREWPTQLDALGDQAPLALWITGAADLRLLALRSVSVVGARACSSYGEEVARSWAAELAGHGWSVLSGAAFGIDAAAHRGALAAGGTTIAIVAGGVDVAYPRAHEALLARIADEGLVVSETPPGESVRRQRFLTRNRVIAALGRATVVIEAAERSGTRATARAAWEMNRPVLAVPGPVTSVTSAGCHRMVRDGEALLVGSAAEVRGLLELGGDAAVAEGSGGVARADRGDARLLPDGLGDRERRVLDALPARAPLDLEALVRASGLAGPDVLAAVGILVARGRVDEHARGWRLARGDGAPRA